MSAVCGHRHFYFSTTYYIHDAKDVRNIAKVRLDKMKSIGLLYPNSHAFGYLYQSYGGKEKTLDEL